MALRSCHNLGRPLFAPLSKTPCRNSNFFMKNCSFDPTQSHKVHDPVEDQKLCVFLIEKAMAKLTPQKEKILDIFDLRGFKTANADISFLTFLELRKQSGSFSGGSSYGAGFLGD